jgi:hypothetical protein
MVYGTPYAGIDYNLALCRLQSQLQHIYHGQPFARVDLNLSWIRLYPQVRVFGFGLRKEFCGRCLSEFVDWRSSGMLVFLTQLCELLPI